MRLNPPMSAERVAGGLARVYGMLHYTNRTKHVVRKVDTISPSITGT